MDGQIDADTEAVLRSSAWFATMPEPVRNAVLAAGHLRRLAAGTLLFEQDGPTSGLHAVIAGEVRVSGVSSDGNAVIIGIVRAGEWVGFLSCLDHLPHAWSGVAGDKTQVFTLTPQAVARVFEADVPTYRLLQAPELAAGRKLHRYILEDFGLPLAQRVAARLSDLARWPYGPASGPVATLKNISQEDLAMSVGATRPRINEILRDLAVRGLIELGYGRITILDPPGVESFARTG